MLRSAPRSNPMTAKATELHCLVRFATAISAITSRGGCREAHLDYIAWHRELPKEMASIMQQLVRCTTLYCVQYYMIV